MTDSRFEALETRLLFLEDTQQKLDEVLAEQQQQLLDLRRLVVMLTDRIHEAEAARQEAPEPPPPHY